jgi:hypothetical protein
MSQSEHIVPEASSNGQPQEEEFPFGANAPEGPVAEPEISDPAPDLATPVVRTKRPYHRKAPKPPKPVEQPTMAALAATVQSAETSDPFDPAALRLSPSFQASIGVKKILLTIPVKKPDRSAFVRAHPDENYRLQTACIELKDERGELYVVAPSLWPELATEPLFRPKLLVTAITRQGALFLWPLNLPREDGRTDEWTRTGLEAVGMATKGWVRVQADMNVGGYSVAQPCASLPDPEWPALSLREILRIAFRERMIDTLDHPILRRLRGEA